MERSKLCMKQTNKHFIKSHEMKSNNFAGVWLIKRAHFDGFVGVCEHLCDAKLSNEQR